MNYCVPNLSIKGVICRKMDIMKFLNEFTLAAECEDTVVLTLKYVMDVCRHVPIQGPALHGLQRLCPSWNGKTGTGLGCGRCPAALLLSLPKTKLCLSHRAIWDMLGH